MNAVILCAGFATRMYPLTENFPKPLLTVAGRPVLDYLMDQITTLPRLQKIHIVSNAKFFDHFCRWHSARKARRERGEMTIQILNDGATDNENRLGAARDLQFALNTIERPSRVLRLHEKPKSPPSEWFCPPLYFFQPSLWSKIESFLRTSGSHDAPGHFIHYLSQQEPVDAFRLEATRLDIGSVDSYHAADRQLQHQAV